MNVLTNSELTEKLKNIVSIFNDADSGRIFGEDEDGQLIPMSQEIFELVVVSLMDSKKKIIECFDRKYKVTIEEL